MLRRCIDIDTYLLKFPSTPVRLPWAQVGRASDTISPPVNRSQARVWCKLICFVNSWAGFSATSRPLLLPTVPRPDSAHGVIFISLPLISWILFLDHFQNAYSSVVKPFIEATAVVTRSTARLFFLN